MAKLPLTVTIWLAALVSFVGALYLYRISHLRPWQTAVILTASVAVGVLGVEVAIDRLGWVTGIVVGVGVGDLVSVEGLSYVLVRNFERRQLRDHFKQDPTNYAHIQRHWLLGWLVRRLER